MWKIIGGGAIEKTVEKIIYKTVRRVIGKQHKRLCRRLYNII